MLAILLGSFLAGLTKLLVLWRSRIAKAYWLICFGSGLETTFIVRYALHALCCFHVFVRYHTSIATSDDNLATTTDFADDHTLRNGLDDGAARNTRDIELEWPAGQCRTNGIIGNVEYLLGLDTSHTIRYKVQQQVTHCEVVPVRTRSRCRM